MTITPVLSPRPSHASIGQRRPVPVLGALIVLAIILSVLSLSVGASWIPVADSLRALVGDTSTDGAHIVATFQLPRVALAWCVGSALAVSGAVLQGIIRNPLAAPDIIGVTRGAGFAGMVLLIGLPQASFVFVAPAAFIGGLIAAALVYVLAYRRGASPTRLALVGIAVGAAFEAGIRFLLVRNPLDVNSALIWLTGSLFGRQLRDVLVIVPVLVILIPMVLRSAHRLDVLGLGDDMASGLGEAVESTRRMLLLLSLIHI